MDTLLAALAGIDWALYGAWALTITLLALGLVGSVVPLLPGPVLILVAVGLHAWLRPQSGLSLWSIGIITVLVVVTYVLDVLAGAIGAKRYGSSRWGIGGVVIGGIIGMFFGLPGLVLGPLLGGFCFELWLGEKDVQGASRSTWGTVLGTVAGLAMRFALSLMMVAIFVLDVLVGAGSSVG
jgi:uncharacterized protein